MKKLISIIIYVFVCAFAATASVTLVRNGKPEGRIVAGTSVVDIKAAHLLNDFIGRISGAQLPVVGQDVKPRKGDVVISGPYTDGLTEDGFRLSTGGGRLFISSGGDKGAIYGAVDLLEQLGVNYYGDNEYTLRKMKDVVIPDMNKAENPAFRYRQSQSYALRDSVYRMWMRLEEPRDEFAGGLWVHTFNRILPSDVYGKSHPEYYSFIQGMRRPGQASQWCLTNPEVFEIVATKIDSIFEANPGMNMISVSQNDGNKTYCTCEACSSVMEREGGPSGLFIEFLNKLAARRPDKQFSTLAYLFTMHPPKHVKPLPNVNIMLCDIDTKREVPLTDNESGRDFMKALEGWSKISDNIFVWDYGINFDCYLAPFPNFPILQKNIQLFRDHHVKMHFSQIASSRGGDFAEMRTYMVSKLMWNPDLNADSLMRSFMDGYYGAAAPYLYQYEKLLEGGLLASGKALWIYDSPVTHKDGMLNANSRKRLNELMDQAEAAVAADKTLLDRVRRQRLSLQFPELEIARAEGTATKENIMPLLELFEERVKEYGVPTINERSNSPVDYAELYKERYLNDMTGNKACGAKVRFIAGPSDAYAELGETALTDNIFGGAGYVESWVGWEGKDAAMVLDLGKEETFSKVEGDFLHQLGAWVFFPKGLKVYTSDDDKNWTLMGIVEQPEDRGVQVKFKRIGVISPTPVTARYVKLEIEGIKACPGWHYGVGLPGWIFLDEIIVD